MGYFDDMKTMLGMGMNAADRKTQEFRLQAELSRIRSNLESAHAALGRVVYSHPTLAEKVHLECPGEYEAVLALLKEEKDVQGRIEGLQRQAVATMTPVPRQVVRYVCTKCGAPVTLDIAYCPSCGDNLAELKGQYRMCSTCGTYHTADSVFCMQCGSKTVEIPVASAVRINDEEKAPSNDVQTVESFIQDKAQLSVEPAPIESSADEGEQAMEFAAIEDVVTSAEPTCPNCGVVVTKGDMFCGECGARLNG